MNGIALDSLSEDERAAVRNDHVGFIFQNFQLIPTLTALENVMIPLELQGKNGAKKRAEDLLERDGLGDRKNHYPTQLSGGEQQRVSIARALINKPKLILAEEPTGNLDPETSGEVMELLIAVAKEEGATVLMATHDMSMVEKYPGRILRVEDNEVKEVNTMNQFDPFTSFSAK